MESTRREQRLGDSIAAELDQEAQITMRLFDVIPEDKLGWRPHPKAKSLGELAMHIATTQGEVAQMTVEDSFDVDLTPKSEPANLVEINEAFAASLKTAKEVVLATDDARAYGDFVVSVGGKVVMTAPRAAIWRSIMLNHYYHHRGQLSTYLRELDVKLPSIYGPSADTNPFE